MKMIIAKEYEDLSIKAFEVIRGVVKSNPYAVLGLATGTTPLGLYRHMIEIYRAYYWWEILLLIIIRKK